MSNVTDAVAERTGADPDLVAEIEDEIGREVERKLAEEAVEFSDDVDDILREAVLQEGESGDESGSSDEEDNSSTETTDTTPTDEGGSEDPLMETALRVVEENDIETSDWPAFQSKMRAEDFTQSDASDAWSELKEREVIDQPKESSPPWEDDGGEDSGNGGSETDSTPGGTTESDVDVPDELWLVTADNCPACSRAKDLLDDYIPDPIEVRNVMEDDEIADLVADGLLPTASPMLIRVDGNEISLV